MISGRVNDQLEAIVTIEVRGSGGSRRNIEAVIDTGFTGSLTLPPDLIDELQLAWRSRGRAMLANGQIDQFDIHAATIFWDGVERGVLVERVDIEPLIGTGLLRQHYLSIEMIVGGTVQIERVKPDEGSSD